MSFAAKIAETRLSHVNPAQPLQIGKFKITAIPSQHTPATAINNDLGEQITHPLHLPARFYEFKEGGSFIIFTWAATTLNTKA